MREMMSHPALFVIIGASQLPMASRELQLALYVEHSIAMQRYHPRYHCRVNHWQVVRGPKNEAFFARNVTATSGASELLVEPSRHHYDYG